VGSASAGKAGRTATADGKAAGASRSGERRAPGGAAVGATAGTKGEGAAGVVDEAATSAAPVRTTWVLLAVSLAWLAALLYGAKVSINSAQQPEEAVDWASVALPGVIAASVLAAASAGTTVVTVALRRRGSLSTLQRWLAGVGTGTLTGALVGGLVLLGYGHGSSIVLLAGATVAAGVLGGVLAGLPANGVVVAGLTATLAVFLVESVLQVFQSPLRGLFGGGESSQSQWNAGTRLAVTQALVGGLAAGLVAYWSLRRRQPARSQPASKSGQAGQGGRRLVSYLSAGALPGVILLIAEVVTRIGGRQVFAAVAGLSEGDKVLLDYWKNSRLNQALVVLFLGAIVALICFGRTLPKRRR